MILVFLSFSHVSPAVQKLLQDIPSANISYLSLPIGGDETLA